MKSYIFVLSLLLPSILSAQEGDFTFGQISNQELYMKSYDKDTTADAVVLKEFGRTTIDNSQKNILLFYYHVQIKVLNDRGIDKANFVIPIHKSSDGGKNEMVEDVKGSTFNAGSEESHLKQKNIFTTNNARYEDLVKFTLPNVRAGSVIDVKYTLSSPYIYNFRSWNFQSDIPKMYSEYWAQIPSNLDYNISLIGYYKLTKNKREIVNNCLTTFNGGKADCALLKLGLRDVPAFKEEKYMTAKSNYLSAVHFELATVHSFNGGVQKVTGTWEDADHELHTNKDFGIQLKKTKSLFPKTFDTLFSNKENETDKAKTIYTFFQKWFKWDGYTGVFCESGIKKALESQQGNIADINLSLVAALRAAGLNANPVLVSTRDNGVPHDLFPVISDFNYVLVQLKTKDSVYLLDASQPILPFGVFPIDCINGNGRIIYKDKPSAWMPITAPVIRKATFMANLTLDDRGQITGTISRKYTGYSALQKRREMRHYSSKDEYLSEMNSQWGNVKILEDSIIGLDNPDNPLLENMTVQIVGSADSAANKVALNPFFQSFIKDNPFKSDQRNFPVDFGTSESFYTVFILKYPSDYQVISGPKNVSLAMPDKGGRYILERINADNSVTIQTIIQQNKPIYGAKEYPILKEFYNRIIQSERAGLILSKN